MKKDTDYIAIVDYAKQNNKPILLIVFSTAEKTKIKQYKLNKDCVFTIPIISLKDFDGDEIINNIENKIKNNTKITRRELIYLSLAPFMSSIKTLDEQIEKTHSLDEILQSGEYKKKIGDYQIVEYNYMGDMESALVEDSNGKKWIMGGDGFTSV